jgi:hypothetical protein
VNVTQLLPSFDSTAHPGAKPNTYAPTVLDLPFLCAQILKTEHLIVIWSQIGLLAINNLPTEYIAIAHCRPSLSKRLYRSTIGLRICSQPTMPSN